MIINIEQNYAITSASKISNICRPLNEILEIPFFRYIRIFDDGTRTILCNQPDVLRFIYMDEHYPLSWYDNGKPGYLYQQGYALWAVERLNDTQEQSLMEKELIKTLKLSQGIAILMRRSDSTEVYEFCSNSSSIYCINTKLLHRFIFYFREQAVKLRLIANNEKIIVPYSTISTNLTPIINEKDFIEVTQVNRHYLQCEGKDIYLTNQEIQCMSWYCKNKTVAEIAIILGRSNKTIERHIDNIKHKLNCYKQAQLIQKIIALGILN